jgi:hypothetical protein
MHKCLIILHQNVQSNFHNLRVERDFCLTNFVHLLMQIGLARKTLMPNLNNLNQFSKIVTL